MTWASTPMRTGVTSQTRHVIRLRQPRRVTHRGGNDTFCYQHKLIMANRNTGEVVVTTPVRNIVGNGNWDVITTFPGSVCPADA